ncbi:hypothetical protein [Iamia sp. SCSIO 61187]|uniref:hypothetical protein n=1 Tax=Iamia sp. SCSIO 61187 TaxID=2722752 RepID=UPI001C62AFB7|nr:hypothetical protein [Iamia sp. SCSIO 61187]
MPAPAIVAFLSDIGIPVRTGPVSGPTAVPGIAIADGGLVLGPAASIHDGDLLHEAGHLALLAPTQRAAAGGLLPGDLGAGFELGAICWSVAAAWHIGLDLAVVFHPDGYRGDSAWLVETYEGGTHPGLPLLEWAGLTWAPGHEPPGEQPFPAMRQWLRTTEPMDGGAR